ncbi:MAG: hypothetical protein Q9170_006208 [Blastenia crenularia]
MSEYDSAALLDQESNSHDYSSDPEQTALELAFRTWTQENGSQQTQASTHTGRVPSFLFRAGEADMYDEEERNVTANPHSSQTVTPKSTPEPAFSGESDLYFSDESLERLDSTSESGGVALSPQQGDSYDQDSAPNPVERRLFPGALGRGAISTHAHTFRGTARHVGAFQASSSARGNRLDPCHDDGSIFGQPRRRNQLPLPARQTSCCQNSTKQLGQSPENAYLSAFLATNRPSFREPTEEQLTDYPIDSEYLGLEPPPLLRRSQRRRVPTARFSQQSGSSPKPNSLAGSYQNPEPRSASTAKPPITSDYPQAHHALMHFKWDSSGEIFVEYEPLGLRRSSPLRLHRNDLTSSVQQNFPADSKHFMENSRLAGQKRRRVMKDDSSDSGDNGHYPSVWAGSFIKTIYSAASGFISYTSNAYTTKRFLAKPTFSPLAPDANAVFLTLLIPRKFDDATRRQIMWIFQCYAPYIPLCVMEVNAAGEAPRIWEIGEDKVDNRVKIFNEENGPLVSRGEGWSKMATKFTESPLGPRGRGWPTSSTFREHPQALPVEIFQLVGSYLSRDCIQNMRLVNREFERKISRSAFRSVVVPFKPKIYGAATPTVEVTGKGKQQEVISGQEDYDPKKSHVKDGMRVFEEWGPDVGKFALTFEADEDTLKGLPVKKKSAMHEAFWGTYQWPVTHYSRFEQAAKLEQKADETSAMTAAFSKLTGLKELGLSMFSGLGWQTGPDVSDRIKLFKHKPVVFGPQNGIPDDRLCTNTKEWQRIVTDQTNASIRISNKSSKCYYEAVREVSGVLPKMVLKTVAPKPAKIRPPIMFGRVNMETQDISTVDIATEADPRRFYPLPAAPRVVALIDSDVELAESDDDTRSERLVGSNQVVPNRLTIEQVEWLMEMEWAQSAFLSSWCIAVLDNPGVFSCLQTFTIANLSSGLLGSLQRDDIWDALPSLANLTVLVSPDWRQVSKDDQGNVNTKWIQPSTAQQLFYDFLFTTLSRRKQPIKKLKVGYVGGGEHAPGMFARNQNILPAPIMDFSTPRVGVAIEKILFLRHVEHLTLTNCWLSPAPTKAFFAKMRDTKLTTVTFESVSLIADPQADLHMIQSGPPGTDNTAIAQRRNKWLVHDPVIGSWSDIINTITPGPSILHARHAHGILHEQPSPPKPTALESITFNSCGYVRLPHMPVFYLNQSTLPDLLNGPVHCLKKRHRDLQEKMMRCVEDELLGTIVPCLTDEEEGLLNAVWGMQIGWGDRHEKWDAREDGMGEGGLGRFEGVVEKS